MINLLNDMYDLEQTAAVDIDTTLLTLLMNLD